MSEKQKETQTVEIDEVQYDIESFTDQQKSFLNHVADLERKISNASFNLDQLQFGKQAFVSALKESLNEPIEE
jgi:hypothetical protein